MTFVAAHLGRDRAVIAVDSLGYDRNANFARHIDGRPVLYEKVHVFALARFVLTGRGSVDLFRTLRRELIAAESVDQAIDLLPSLLADASTRFSLAGSHRWGGGRDEVYVFGWSEAEGQMVGVGFESAGGSPFEIETLTVSHPDQNRCVFPLRMPPILHEGIDTAEKIARHAFEEVEHARSIDPLAPYGGPLVIAELDRHAIRIVHAGDLGFPATQHNPEPAMQSKTIGALVLSAALAACGGSDEAVEVTQIAANAATVAQSANSVSGSVSDITNNGLGVGSTVNSLSYTNDTLATVVIQIEHSLSFSVSSGTSGYGYVTDEWSVSGGGGAGGVQFSPNIANASATPATHVYSVSVAPGLTITVNLVCWALATSAGTVTTTWSNASSRVTAIKK